MLYEKALGLLRSATNNPHAEFRDGQWEAIEALVVRRTRLLVVERTGWGKSLVYFIATRLLRDDRRGFTLLISPLLSLMRNQITAADRIGLRADTVNSANEEEWSRVTDELHRGAIDLLLISPERLSNEDFWTHKLLPVAGEVGLFVVDEAHCISDWGHDFRPDYKRITRILQALPPNVPALATTATANDRVVDDIQAQLGPHLQLVRGTLTRTSLRLQNIALPTTAERMAWLAENVPSMPGSGIIYTLTKRDADSVSDWLQHQGIDAHAYHGRVGNERREELENALLENQIKALIATTALGMGFDKPDLGFVIHFQRPGSVVLYYQQVGRAGRAVDDAFGVLLGGAEDDEINDFFIRAAFPPEEHSRAVLEALKQAPGGLKTKQIEEEANLSEGQIRKVLRLLAMESPAPLAQIGGEWRATANAWAPDRALIERLGALRRAEKVRMREYQSSQTCLMAFLAEELNDTDVQPCGRCAPCVGHPLLPELPSDATVLEATTFLRRHGSPIDPRRRWISDVVKRLGWPLNIPREHQAERGFTISRWKDGGWGTLVAAGKQRDNRFADELVTRSADAIRNEWRPDPFPTWVTCVPSTRHPDLVPDFAARLAAELRLPFVRAVRKTRETEEQKGMQNSFRQLGNLADAFEVSLPENGVGPVLLVDDTVDSRWTFTLLAALLRTAGSGPVFPFALASTASGPDS